MLQVRCISATSHRTSRQSRGTSVPHTLWFLTPGDGKEGKETPFQPHKSAATTINCFSSRLLIPHRLPPDPRLLLPLLTEPPPQILHPPKIQPRARKHDHEIEDAESPEDPIIPPLVLVIRIEAPSELIAAGVLAELAQAVRAGLHVAARLGDEGRGVGIAGLAGRGGEAGEFRGGAADGSVVRGDAEEAFEEVGEGGEVVHPSAPELWRMVSRGLEWHDRIMEIKRVTGSGGTYSWQCGKGDHHAAEGDHEQEEDWHE